MLFNTQDERKKKSKREKTNVDVLKVMWSTGKEWKIFLEDSHFVWFPTKSILYLHYNVGRIHLSGTE